MIKRDSWGHLYSVVRGEILGLAEDKLLRKHLPRMFSLIKNESRGIDEKSLVLNSILKKLVVGRPTSKEVLRRHCQIAGTCPK